MSTTTTSKLRLPPLGTGSIRMFQAGLRDGLDSFDQPMIEVTRSFTVGTKVGRRCAHIKMRRSR